MQHTPRKTHERCCLLFGWIRLDFSGLRHKDFVDRLEMQSREWKQFYGAEGAKVHDAARSFATNQEVEAKPRC